MNATKITMSKKKPHHLPPVFTWHFLLPHYWPTWALVGFARIIALLPFNVAISLGKLTGRLLYRLAKKRTYIAYTNLAVCYPHLSETELGALTREAVINTGIGLIESVLALWGPTYQFHHRVTIKGLENLTPNNLTPNNKEGILLVGCHMTTLELAGRLLATKHKFDILYKRDPNPLMAYLLVSARKRFNGDSIISVETRKLVDHLRAGRTVWYAPDQDYGIKHSIFAPFFNIPSASVPGTARFAKLGRARVVFFSHVRDDKNHYHITLTPAKSEFPSGDDLTDVTYVNKQFEEMINQAPSQYLWVHRRFKTRPANSRSLYTPKDK